MNRFRPGAIRLALAGLCTLLATGPASAQPHAGTPRHVTETVVTPDTAVWLARLVGRFRFEGIIHHQEIIDFDRNEDAAPNPDLGEDGQVRGPYLYLSDWSEPVNGMGDCIGFGTGPALHCVISVVWPELWRPTGKAQLGGVSDLSPAIVLAGLAPSIGGIRFLLEDHKGLAHPGSSTLSGDSTSIKPPCVNSPGLQTCEQAVTLTARADAKNLYLVLSTSVRFLRNKTDRKLFLEEVTPNDPNSRMEKSTEWVRERLDVTFTLRREPQTMPGAPAATPPAAP